MTESLSQNGFDVSRETLDRLVTYKRLLQEWNPKINLVAPGTLADAWDRHIVDSAQILRHVTQAGNTWTDLGSGGGFPGLVISILLGEISPNTETTLIESDQRKCAFLRTVIRSTGANATVIARRIEDTEPTDASHVSARALAPLDKLLHYVNLHLSNHGKALLPKGENWKREVEDAQESWKFDLIPHKSLTNPQAVILEIGEIEHV